MAIRIGLLTAGSDCTGLNAAIRAIGKTAIGDLGMEMLGFHDGFRGLVEDQVIPIAATDLSGILTTGGTILGTSRDLPHTFPTAGQVADLTEQAIQTYARHRLDALVCIGGRETQDTALRLSKRGLNVITLPKAIDNDVPMTDYTIGFDTALEVATQSIDRLHSTAHSHHRIILVEMMGGHSGWLTLGAGMAGGADVILIPEIAFDIYKVAEALERRHQAGKRFSIVAVSEHLVSKEDIAFGERLRRVNANMRSDAERVQVEAQLCKIESQHTDTTFHVSNRLKELTGLETRITILGYLLRGGVPSSMDRLLATQLGTACASFVHQGRFGVMVAMRGGNIETVPLERVAGQHKPIPADHPWLESARRVGTCLGD